jgi:hypothetical protein
MMLLFEQLYAMKASAGLLLSPAIPRIISIHGSLLPANFIFFPEEWGAISRSHCFPRPFSSPPEIIFYGSFYPLDRFLYLIHIHIHNLLPPVHPWRGTQLPSYPLTLVHLCVFLLLGLPPFHMVVHSPRQLLLLLPLDTLQVLHLFLISHQYVDEEGLLIGSLQLYPGVLR